MQPANSSQLLLLADHIKLALLDRDRAPNPSAHDAELTRSLASLRTELEHLESSNTDPLTAGDLRRQYDELATDFSAKTTTSPSRPPLPPSSSSYTKKSVRFSDHPASDSARFTDSPSTGSARFTDNPSTGSARFTDNPSTGSGRDSGRFTEQAADADPNRGALLPYTDDGDDDAPPDHSERTNEQIYAYHDNVMRDQDAQLDELGRSVGRQRELSIQIGSELDEHSHMLDDVEGHVDRHQTQIDRARGRLGKIARKAKDNIQMTIIAILVIVLMLLVIILK